MKAARRSIPFFLAEQVEGKVALLPHGHDPDSLVREKGATGITDLVERAKPLAEFVFEALVEEFGLTLSGKSQIMQELAALVQEASDPGQKDLMVAHFSEKLGVSPARFLSGPVRTFQAERQDVGERSRSFQQLPRKQRQLVDFLVLYPEFLQELQKGGLAKVVTEPALQELVHSLEHLGKIGPVAPEQLLTLLPGEMERQYVADLLMRGAEAGDEDGQRGKELCDELLLWIKSALRQQDGASLQKQIHEAQRSGDFALVESLLKEKMNVIREKGPLSR